MSCGQISSGHSMSWSSAVSRSIGIATSGFATIIGSATATGQGRSTHQYGPVAPILSSRIGGTWVL